MSQRGTNFIIHCNEIPIYVVLFWELRGLSPNFHIHVSVSDFYIPRIGPYIFLQQNRQAGSREVVLYYTSTKFEGTLLLFNGTG
jgi:hypothetical protein